MPLQTSVKELRVMEWIPAEIVSLLCRGFVLRCFQQLSEIQCVVEQVWMSCLTSFGSAVLAVVVVT